MENLLRICPTSPFATRTFRIMCSSNFSSSSIVTPRSLSLESVQNVWGTRTRFIDRGQRLFSGKKGDGQPRSQGHLLPWELLLDKFIWCILYQPQYHTYEWILFPDMTNASVETQPTSDHFVSASPFQLKPLLLMTSSPLNDVTTPILMTSCDFFYSIWCNLGSSIILPSFIANGSF